MNEIKEVITETKRVLDSYQVPGAIVAMAHEGKMAYSNGIGYRDIENSLPVDNHTVFGLASITKSFTSVAIMHLQESGKLKVQDSVIKYIPEFYVKDQEHLKAITIHHFMTHSSGLPPMSSLEYTMRLPDENYPGTYRHVGEDKKQQLIDTYEQLLTFIKETNVNLIAAPGTHFSYSNEAYGLLGLIIERVSGKPYHEYVQDHIIKPCNMRHTSFRVEDYGSYDNICKSYGSKSNDKEKYIESDLHWMDSVPMRSTGFIKSTASDMIKYAEIFRNKGLVDGTQIISSDSVKEMIKPHMKVHVGRYYGYGLSIVPDYFGATLVEHGGSLRSISSHFSVIPEKGVSGIFVANLMGVPVSNLLHKFLNTYFGRQMNTPYVEYEKYDVALEEIKQYEGVYVSDEGIRVILKIENDELVFEHEAGTYPTMFIRKNVFVVYFKDSESLIEVLLDECDSPYAITYNTRIVQKVR